MKAKVLKISLNGMLIAQQIIPDDHFATMKMGTSAGVIEVTVDYTKEEPRRRSATRGPG
jgi:hypothetical protein